VVDTSRRALVLGSGGLTGLAWQVGVLDGLADGGLAWNADLLVGTSAGALLAARLAAGEAIRDVADALGADRTFRSNPGESARQPGGGGAVSGAVPVSAAIRLVAAQLHPHRRQAVVGLGRRAAAEWTPEASGRWVDAVAGDLAGRGWPAPLVVVVTDAAIGRPVLFRARRPVDLALAVAASCAMPGVLPAVRIGGRLYFDGGLRSPANLDAAGAADVVVALAPLTGALRAHRRPGVQAARLRASGATVVLLTPDAAGRRAIGLDVLAGDRVPACVEAGRAFGRRRVADVGAAWGE
jgi:NTE family protein